VRAGHCPACGGTLSTRIEDISDAPLPDADPFLVVDRCADCLREYGAQLSYGLAYHPASVAFHWNRGLDVSRKGLWEFHEVAIADRWTAERVESDPDRYRVSFRQGTDALRMRVDADATVEATERLRRRDPDP
jgi:hypothetical protein